LHVGWEDFATWHIWSYISETAQELEDWHTVTMDKLLKVVCVLSNDDIADDCIFSPGEAGHFRFGTHQSQWRVTDNMARVT